MTTLYPRSAISIFVEVLQADGGDYAVCVNAATLALIDAGIPIRDVCCAVSCGVAIKDNVAYSLLDLGRFLRRFSELIFRSVLGRISEDTDDCGNRNAKDRRDGVF